MDYLGLAVEVIGESPAELIGESSVFRYGAY